MNDKKQPAMKIDEGIRHSRQRGQDTPDGGDNLCKDLLAKGNLENVRKIKEVGTAAFRRMQGEGGRGNGGGRGTSQGFAK